jgi:hypothetical protein
MKTNAYTHTLGGLAALLLMLPAPAFAALAVPFSSAEVLKRPAGVKDVTVKYTRGMRYAGLAMIGNDTVTIYNTTGVSEAPESLWDALDAAHLKEQLGLKRVVKLGPHWWVSDSVELKLSETVYKLGDLRFRWMASVPPHLAGHGDELAAQSYRVFELTKRGTWIYAKSKPVYELVSPKGETYIMQSSSRPVDASLAKLGDRLKLSPGWTFHTRTPGQDLSLVCDGKVKVLFDDQRNVYCHISKAH